MTLVEWHLVVPERSATSLNQLFQVSVAQFIGEVPPHAKNNDLLIKMSVLE